MTQQPYPTGPTSTGPEALGPAPERGAPAYGQPYPGGAGPAPMTPSDETTWSTVTHLSWIAGSFVALPFLAPLVLFLVLKDRGPFVRHHTAEALSFQLSLLVYGLGVTVVGGLLSVVTLGVLVPLWAVAGGALVVVGAVFTVLAAIASSRGQWYRYPLTIRFVR
ncbi:DUF4870 domain-containing protein [Jannaschia sp. R86511]|uniref:DUF4870 domain-containing protein n=1 Tax=Jannaschia sp. R86511 TaxID=3093853 RepID=UPI0036D29746